MKKKIILANIFLLMIIISSVLFITSCDKENLDERPDLPPVESLIMNFSDFQQQPATSKGIVATYNNYSYAYFTVFFWNTFTTVTLVLPVTAYGYALQQEPVYLGDSKWEWSYEVTWGALEYVATLTGERLNNEEFSMEMSIALASVPNVRFVWFDGVVRYDHTSATWNMYKSDDGTSVKIIEVMWEKDFETEVTSLKYTYIEPGQDETGSYICYGLNPEMVYDASYTVSLSGSMINIEWDSETKAGRVKNPDYFVDSAWHCWNNLLEDIDCPAK